MGRVSKQQGKDGFMEGVSSPYSDFNLVCDTPLCSIRASGGQVTYKSHTIDGNGAQTDNLFTVSGIVRVLEIYAIADTVTDATTFSGVKFELDDGTAQSDITDAVDASGILAGGVLLKDHGVATALSFLDNAAGVVEETTGFFETDPIILVQKASTTTYIRLSFTGDGSTDIDMTFYVRWVPFNSTSNIAAV